MCQGDRVSTLDDKSASKLDFERRKINLYKKKMVKTERITFGRRIAKVFNPKILIKGRAK